jgi:diphthamide biosynthesis protein 7
MRLRTLETGGLGIVSEIDTDAVLDLKWFKDQLYVAHSTGSISVLDCKEGKLSVRLKRSLIESEVLIMSLTVTTEGILISTSEGTIMSLDHDLKVRKSVKVSELEVWTQSCNYASLDQNTVFAGSDDGALSVVDLRSESVTLCNRRTHGAGITAILPYTEVTFLSGSYDDTIRSFDMRNLRRPVHEANLGGGVWRIVPDHKQGSFLACCMYDGAKLVDLTPQGFNNTADVRFHNSIVYGGDVRHQNDTTMYATCSFYDRRVCLWQCNK